MVLRFREFAGVAREKPNHVIHDHPNRTQPMTMTPMFSLFACGLEVG